MYDHGKLDWTRGYLDLLFPRPGEKIANKTHRFVMDHKLLLEWGG